MRWIYLVKFTIYGAIASYDYTIGSKYTICWMLLAILTLAFHIIEEIKHTIHETKT